MTLPAVDAIKKYNPDIRLGFVIAKSSFDVIKNYPLIDRVYSYDKASLEKWEKERRYGKILGYIRSFVREIRQDDWDIAIDFQGFFETSFIPYLAKIKKIYARKHGSQRLFLSNGISRDSYAGKDALGWYMFLAFKTGLIPEDAPVNYFYPLSDVERSWADAELKAENGRKLRIGISPTTRWISKTWPAESYSQLIRAIHARYDATVFLFGAPSDRGVADQILTDNDGVADYVGSISLSHMAALVQRMDVFISGDSAPMHIAASFQLPQLVFFGPTDPERTGPYNSKAVLLSSHESCAPCFKKVCPLTTGKDNCMHNITVADVMRELHKIVDGKTLS